MKHRRKDENNYYYNCYTSDIFAISLLLKKKTNEFCSSFCRFLHQNKIEKIDKSSFEGLGNLRKL